LNGALWGGKGRRGAMTGMTKQAFIALSALRHRISARSAGA
jgi:hypothetical protein